MKRRKKVLSILLSCAMTFSAMQPLGAFAADTSVNAEIAQESRAAVNLARSAAMTSSGNETADFNASKTNDGSIERTSRWASPADGAGKPIGSNHWLCMNFGSVKTVASVAIEWERKNATNYVIQSSTDGSTWNDVKTFTSVPAEFRDIINFDNAVQAQYMRVLIKSFNSTAENREGKTDNWGTVSIYEFEAYEETLKPELNLDTIIPAYDSASQKVIFDTPEGYTVANNGTDFEQIVADDFTVQQPLTDKTVKLALKFTETATGEETISKEHAVLIPGIHSNSAGNEKPQVIPEISEWYSDSTGHFQLDASGSIVINSEALRYAGEEFQKDLADITGVTLPVKVGSTALAGDFYFTLGSGDTLLGEEGYAMTIGDHVHTEAIDATGIYWATRTILQAMKLSDDGLSIPEGQMRDYPKYPVRGFVFDVGRKAVSLDTLKDMAKNMAWYKMNDFQVHLSDNYIFLEDYYNSDDPDPLDGYAGYTGYRLESDIANDEGETIASKDYHYSKKEFKEFIGECRKFGVDIVPEIDVPAHAMAITEVFPEYAVNSWNPRNTKRSIVDHLDISKPEVVDFTKTIFDDYIQDQTFDADTVIHIGADEFESSATAYREFLNTMLPYIKKTNTVRLWGGLTWIKDNKTEITPEAIDGAQINLWSSSWADGVEMYNMGFDLINTLDTFGYMVPSGDGSTGAYGDYLNKTTIFNSFAPNSVGRSGGYTALPAGDKQVLGGAFAVWQDNIDKKASGLSEEDLFLRFFDALPLYAEKTWANGQEKGSVDAIDALAETLSIAPNTNPYAEETSVEDVYAEYNFDSGLEKDSSANERNLTTPTNVKTVSEAGSNALKLNGDASYVETPIEKLGSTKGNALSFTLKLDEVKPGQILFEEDAAYGTHDIRITENNKLGFTRELYDYEFDYELVPGETADITITSTPQNAALYVNNQFVSNAAGRFVHKDIVKKSEITNASFALPLERIGSLENAVKGTIDNIRVTGEYKDPTLVPTEDFAITCDNENVLVGGKEGPATLAFDGNPGTIWHSNYTPKQELPATITVDMGKTYILNKVGYLPRQDGNKEGNGIIIQYAVSVSMDGTNYTEVSSGNLDADATQKLISFTPVEARYIKFTANAGKNGFASAAEITFHQEVKADPVVDKSKLQTLYDSYKGTVNDHYTTESWNAFQTALNHAKTILDNAAATQEAVDSALTELQNAAGKLTKNPVTPVDKKALQSLYNSCAGLKEADYTADSWKAFSETLAGAKAVLESQTANQTAVNQAFTALQNAKNSLKKANAPAPLPKKGSIQPYKTLKYKVTASTEKAKTVAIIGAKKKTYTKLTIPASIKIQGYTYKVTSVANKAFLKNTRLKTVVIGSNITKIGKESFSGCKKLKNISITSKKVKKIGKNAFKGISAKAKIKVPRKKLASYKGYLKKAKLSSKVKVVKK